MNGVILQVRSSRIALWFGLVGGALAWLTHLISAYVAAEFGCVGRLGEVRYLEVSVVAWVELVLTTFTTLVSATATAVAYRNHQILRLRATQRGFESATTNIARLGMLTSGLFTLIILFESIPILYYLRDC